MFRNVATHCSACNTVDPDGYIYKVGTDSKTPGPDVECPACKATGTLSTVDLQGPSFAETKTAWGDSHWQRWDYGLGCYTHSKAHRDSVMRSLGAREGYANG